MQIVNLFLFELINLNSIELPLTGSATYLLSPFPELIIATPELVIEAVGAGEDCVRYPNSDNMSAGESLSNVYSGPSPPSISTP